jgi:F-type H+-transporting ATPase subunit alpha
VAIIFAATNGYLDPYPVTEARRYEKELYTFLETRHPDILRGIAEKKDIKGELTDKLKAALQEFAGTFQVQAAAQA